MPVRKGRVSARKPTTRRATMKGSKKPARAGSKRPRKRPRAHAVGLVNRSLERHSFSASSTRPSARPSAGPVSSSSLVPDETTAGTGVRARTVRGDRRRGPLDPVPPQTGRARYARNFEGTLRSPLGLAPSGAAPGLAPLARGGRERPRLGGSGMTERSSSTESFDVDPPPRARHRAEGTGRSIARRGGRSSVRSAREPAFWVDPRVAEMFRRRDQDDVLAPPARAAAELPRSTGRRRAPLRLEAPPPALPGVSSEGGPAGLPPASAAAALSRSESHRRALEAHLAALEAASPALPGVPPPGGARRPPASAATALSQSESYWRALEAAAGLPRIAGHWRPSHPLEAAPPAIPGIPPPGGAARIALPIGDGAVLRVVPPPRGLAGMLSRSAGSRRSSARRGARVSAGSAREPAHWVHPRIAEMFRRRDEDPVLDRPSGAAAELPPSVDRGRAPPRLEAAPPALPGVPPPGGAARMAIPTGDGAALPGVPATGRAVRRPARPPPAGVARRPAPAVRGGGEPPVPLAADCVHTVRRLADGRMVTVRRCTPSKVVLQPGSTVGSSRRSSRPSSGRASRTSRR